MVTHETDIARKEGHSYRAYSIEVEDVNDLEGLIKYLVGFLETANQNDRKMLVEVWYYPIKGWTDKSP